MSIYMKLPDVKGSVQTKHYTGWIEIEDLDFSGLTNPLDMTVGNRMNRSGTRPSFGQIALLKCLDDSSIHLFDAVHSNKVYPSIEFHYVTTGDEPFTYAKTTLSNGAITHYSEVFNKSVGQPRESIHIAYTQIERSFTPRDAQNRASSPMIAGYNLETATKL